MVPRAWCAVVLIAGAGCTGDLVELSRPSLQVDLGPAAPAESPDLSDPPAAPDGGAAPSADAGRATDLAPAPAPIHFSDVQADIDQLGCAAASCHGGSQTPVLQRMPVDRAANLAAFKMFATMGASSPVLTKNLVGSGVDHTGGKSFQNQTDPVYQRWLAWIQGGNLP